MVVQGHPRSSISLPVQSAYATFCSETIATLIQFCAVSKISCTLILLKTVTMIQTSEVWECLPRTKSAPRSEVFKLIIRKFVVKWLVLYQSYNYRLMDRQTDRQLTYMAIPHYIHRAVMI